MKKKSLLLWGVLLCMVVLMVNEGRVGAAAITPNIPNETDWEFQYSDEFEGTGPSDIWFPYYMPHWAESEAGAATKYEMKDGVINLQVTQEDPYWKPTTHSGYKVSGMFGATRDYLNTYPAKNTSLAKHYPATDKYALKYGYVEIRAKFRSASGLCPAFWMIGYQDEVQQMSEIDIFEIVASRPNEVLFTLHPKGDPNLTYESHKVNMGVDLSQDFHTYGFEWAPNYLKLYIDGELKATINQSINYRMTPILSLNYSDNPNNWYGTVDPNMDGPATYEIDYFRVFKNKYQSGTTIAEEPTIGDNLAPYGYASITGLTGLEYEATPTYNLNDEKDDTYVYSAANPAYPVYLYLDWSKDQSFDTLILKNAYAQQQGIKNFDIEVSDNGVDNWTTVKTNIEPDWQTNSNIVEGFKVTFDKVVDKRHFRIKVNEANLINNKFIVNEMMVGEGLALPPVSTKIPLEATASTNMGVYSNYIVSNMVDGNRSTYYWSNELGNIGTYVQLNFSEVKTVTEIDLDMGINDVAFIHYGQMEYSVDGDTWVSIDAPQNAKHIIMTGLDIQAKYIRYRSLENQGNWVSVAEFSAY